MRFRTIAAGILVLFAISANTSIAACGDKFLNLALGTRYDRSPAVRQKAGVLMFVSAGSALEGAMARLSVDAGLRKEGYRPTTVASAAEFDAALRQHKWDVVVIDWRDAASASRLIGTSRGPQIVPVLMTSTKDTLKQAKQQYRVVVNAPTKSRAFLDTIDDAMDLNDAAAEAAAKAAKAEQKAKR